MHYELAIYSEQLWANNTVSEPIAEGVIGSGI